MLLPATHVGDDGLARYTATSDDDRLDQQLARAKVMAVGIAGPVTARILDELLAKFAPNPDDLFQLLQGLPHVTQATAKSLVKALVAFGSGEHETAAVLAMPRIETLVAALCKREERPAVQGAA